MEGVEITAKFLIPHYKNYQEYQTFIADVTHDAAKILKGNEFCMVTSLLNLDQLTDSSQQYRRCSTNFDDDTAYDDTAEFDYIRCFIELDRFRLSQDELEAAHEANDIIFLHQVVVNPDLSVWMTRNEQYIADVRVTYFMRRGPGIDNLSIVAPFSRIHRIPMDYNWMTRDSTHNFTMEITDSILPLDSLSPCIRPPLSTKASSFPSTTVLVDINIHKNSVHDFCKMEGVEVTAKLISPLYKNYQEYQTFIADVTHDAAKILKGKEFCMVTSLLNLDQLSDSSRQYRRCRSNFDDDTVSNEDYVRCFIELDRLRFSQNELQAVLKAEDIIFLHQVVVNSDLSIWRTRNQLYIADVRVTYFMRRWTGVDILSIVALFPQKRKYAGLMALAEAIERTNFSGRVYW